MSSETEAQQCYLMTLVCNAALDLSTDPLTATCFMLGMWQPQHYLSTLIALA